MSKSTAAYWNPLSPENRKEWKPVEGLEDMAEEITLAVDKETGDYTRITRFLPGADTTRFGSKSHTYPEEILVLEGRLFDVAFDRWLVAGEYASRPPGEGHGPFCTDTGCIVLEISYPSQTRKS
jgi:hypothetical protein